MRWVFDKCGRGGDPNHLADADVFRNAESSGNWSKVGEGMADTLARILRDAAPVPWSAQDQQGGGLHDSFVDSLQVAEQHLRQSSTAAEVVGGLCLAVKAMKAMTLKATGSTPPPY